MKDQSNLTVPELLAEAALKWPEKTALLFDPSMDSITYLELEERTNAIASQLIELGVNPGDRVAVMSKNEIEYPLSWLGIRGQRAMAEGSSRTWIRRCCCKLKGCNSSI